MHVRLTPYPAQFHNLPDWFDDRVEILTDRLTIPRGIWLKCSESLLDRLRKRCDGNSDEGQVQRLTEASEAILAILRDEDSASAQSGATPRGESGGAGGVGDAAENSNHDNSMLTPT